MAKHFSVEWLSQSFHSPVTYSDTSNYDDRIHSKNDSVASCATGRRHNMPNTDMSVVPSMTDLLHTDTEDNDREATPVPTSPTGLLSLYESIMIAYYPLSLQKLLSCCHICNPHICFIQTVAATHQALRARSGTSVRASRVPTVGWEPNSPLSRYLNWKRHSISTNTLVPHKDGKSPRNCTSLKLRWGNDEFIALFWLWLW